MSSTSITGSLSALGRLSARIRGKSRVGRTSAGRRLSLGRPLLLQLVPLFIAFTVLFPILWIFSLSLDPRDISRPSELHLNPPGASVQAYQAVLERPPQHPSS